VCIMMRFREKNSQDWDFFMVDEWVNRLEIARILDM